MEERKTRSGAFYRRNDLGLAIGVSHVPGLKRPCLCIEAGNTLYKIASFNNEEAAELFEQCLEKFLGGMLFKGLNQQSKPNQ